MYDDGNFRLSHGCVFILIWNCVESNKIKYKILEYRRDNKLKCFYFFSDPNNKKKQVKKKKCFFFPSLMNVFFHCSDSKKDENFFRL